MRTDPRIDAYIAGVPDYAAPLFAHLRRIAHEAMPDGAETLKWGKPTFTYRGKNVATFAAFRQHAMFAIHGDGRQGQDGEGGKPTSLADLPADSALSAALEAACRRIDREGTAVARTRTARPAPRPLPPMHPQSAAALADRPDALATFEGFPASERREYLDWINQARRDATRAARIEQAVAWLSEGKRRLWKYAGR